MAAYGAYVKRTLRATCEKRWAESVAHRLDPMPYSTYEAEPPARLSAIARGSAGWLPLVHTRGWCSLRAHVTPLAHRNGRPHWRRDGVCIFCGRDAPAIYHHVFGDCEAWGEERAKVRSLGGLGGALGHLGAVLDILAPEKRWETAAIEMAGAIDARARKWWREQGGFHE